MKMSVQRLHNPLFTDNSNAKKSRMSPIDAMDMNYLVYYKKGSKKGSVNWEASYHNLKESYVDEKHELAKSVASLTAEKDHLKRLALKSYERLLNKPEVGQLRNVSSAPPSSNQSVNENSIKRGK